MRRYQSLIALNASVFLFMLGVGVMVALLPGRIIALSGSVSDVGYLASAFAIPYILFQLPVGSLADRFGFKVFLSGGYFLCALTGVLYYFAQTASMVFFGRMVQGIGEAPLWALAPALLSLQFPGGRGKVMGVYNASIHIGLTAGSALGILLLPVWQGSGAFLFFSGTSLAGGIITLCFLEKTSRASFQEQLSIDRMRLLSIAAQPENAAAFSGVLLYGAGYGIFLTMIPAFLIDIRHGDQALVGLLFLLFYLAVSVSQLITGPLSDRVGRRQPMILGMFMAALGLAFFVRLGQPWFYMLLTAASLGLGMFAVSSMAYLNERAPDSLKGTISGAFYLFWGMGFFSGPLLLGMFSRWGRFETGFQLLSILFLCEAACLIFIRERSRRPGREAV